MRIARNLTIALAAIMAVQALAGRLFHDQYRDDALIVSTWFGNDWITFALAVPMLLLGSMDARRSVRSLLVWLGVLAYAVYNYGFYLFGATLNAFFPLYVSAFVLATVALIVVLAHIDVAAVAASFHLRTPVRVVGGSLFLVGAGLACAWMVMWASYIFAGRPTPVEPEAFKTVAALDLSLMVPALTTGGILLWRRSPWGYVISATASIQGALYLLVLSVNSIVAIQRGLVVAPGELPVWGGLTVLTTTLAIALVGNVRGQPSQLW